MKRAKRIYLLLGVLAAVCVAAFAVLKYEEHKELIQNTDEIILEVDPGTVDTLSWEYEGETLAFHRDEEEHWNYDGDEAFPVDDEKIADLLAQFEAFGAAFIIEEVTDFGQYGLDEPVCTINLAAGEESWEILVGDYSAMDEQRYVSIGDGNVYLVQGDPVDTFDAELKDLIKNDEIPDFDRADSIQFTGEDSYQVVYQEDSGAARSEDDVYFKEEGGALLPLDTGLVNSYFSSIRSLSLTDYVTYNDTEEELASYGLDNPELTVTVNYVAEDEEGAETTGTFTLSISRDPAELSAAADSSADAEGEDAEEESADDITAYLRVDESPIVYQITGYSYQDLMAASYDDLRHQAVLTADFEDVTGIGITLEDTQYQITTEGTGEDKVFSYAGEELDTGDLQSALEGLVASSFTQESPTQKEEIALTVYLDSETCPQVEIALYRYDGEQCLAVVDGEPVSLVPRSAVVDLIEAINAIVL